MYYMLSPTEMLRITLLCPNECTIRMSSGRVLWFIVLKRPVVFPLPAPNFLLYEKVSRDYELLLPTYDEIFVRSLALNKAKWRFEPYAVLQP
jgi:hypothetical protein